MYLFAKLCNIFGEAFFIDVSIVVTDVGNDVTYCGISVNTCVDITLFIT